MLTRSSNHAAHYVGLEDGVPTVVTLSKMGQRQAAQVASGCLHLPLPSHFDSFVFQIQACQSGPVLGSFDFSRSASFFAQCMMELVGSTSGGRLGGREFQEQHYELTEDNGGSVAYDQLVVGTLVILCRRYSKSFAIKDHYFDGNTGFFVPRHLADDGGLASLRCTCQLEFRNFVTAEKQLPCFSCYLENWGPIHPIDEVYSWYVHDAVILTMEDGMAVRGRGDERRRTIVECAFLIQSHVAAMRQNMTENNNNVVEISRHFQTMWAHGSLN